MNAAPPLPAATCPADEGTAAILRGVNVSPVAG